MFDLTGKKALVTGATGGIGEGIARAFHKAGAEIAISGRQVAKLEALAAELGERVHVVPCDLADKAQVAKLIDEASAKLGRVDILVNNAGLTKDNLFMVMKDEQWDDVIAVNLTAVYAVSRIFVPGMKKRKSGRIINIASVAGIRGLTDGSAYGASKAGVIGFSIGLSKELVGDGITVNCVAPALIDTDLKLQMSDDFIQKAADRVPMKRLGKAEEVAATVAWIATPACSFTTGAVFDVAGGRLGL